MKGPIPKSVDLKRLNGNPGGKPLQTVTRIQGRTSVTRPRGLPEDAKRAWEIIVEPLEEMGIVDELDAVALEAMCLAFARLKQAQRILSRDGLIAVGSKGQPVEHPAISIERQSSLTLLRYAEQYACTPAARTRLGLAQLHKATMADVLHESIGSSPREVGLGPAGSGLSVADEEWE